MKQKQKLKPLDAKLKPLDAAVVYSTAKVMGPYSAAAKALADCQSRRANGEVVRFYTNGSSIVVHGIKEI